MNKVELVSAVVEVLGGQVSGEKLTKKDATVIVDAVFDVIGDELVEGGEVKIANFGKFRVDEVAGRLGRNPQTKEAMQIEAYKAPKFKFSSVLRSAIKSK